MRRRCIIIGMVTMALITGCRSTTAGRSGVTSVQTASVTPKPEAGGEIIQASATRWSNKEAGGECRH